MVKVDASPQPAPASAVKAEVAPVGRLRRQGSISIKSSLSPALTNSSDLAETEAAPLPPITQQELADAWKVMLEAMRAELPRLTAQLEGRQLRMVGHNQFELVVDNNFLEAEIKPHLVRMLTYLRQRCHRPGLNCKIVVEYQKQQAVAYTAREKYDVMVRQNPQLDKLRDLFPEIDL